MNITDKVMEMKNRLFELVDKNETTIEHELQFLDEYYMNEHYKLPDWFEVAKGLLKVQLEV